MAAALRENTVKVEGIIAQVERKLEQHYERIARLLADYRQDNHRAVMGIYTRIVSLEDTYNTDTSRRVERQKETDQTNQGIDRRLGLIEGNQKFVWRLAMFAGLVAVGIMVGVSIARWLL